MKTQLEETIKACLLAINKNNYPLTPHLPVDHNLPPEADSQIRNSDMRRVYAKALQHLLEAERILVEAGAFYVEETKPGSKVGTVPRKQSVSPTVGAGEVIRVRNIPEPKQAFPIEAFDESHPSGQCWDPDCEKCFPREDWSEPTNGIRDPETGKTSYPAQVEPILPQIVEVKTFKEADKQQVGQPSGAHLPAGMEPSDISLSPPAQVPPKPRV